MDITDKLGSLSIKDDEQELGQPLVADTTNQHDQQGNADRSDIGGKIDDRNNNNNIPEDSDDSDEDEDEVGRDFDLARDVIESLLPHRSSAGPFETNNLDGLAKHIASGKAKNIIVLTGAGISVAAGIPDFRSPGTGLYSQLSKYQLPYPEAIFELDFFLENPKPFCSLAKEMFPGKFEPTPVHYFIRLLDEKGLLCRNYTQNIDTLERVAGVRDEKLVEAHGSFATAHCLNPVCNAEYSMEWVKEILFKDQVPRCTVCNSYVKPDIVFFGESLPERFFRLVLQDFPKCDLLIVIGTSLKVNPFASLVNRVPPSTPRVIINNVQLSPYGFDFDSDHSRDLSLVGDCQDMIGKLVEKLGWKDDFETMMCKNNNNSNSRDKYNSDNNNNNKVAPQALQIKHSC